MNFFSKAFLERHRLKLLFLVIWLHVSALDLFFITYNGPVFLWQKNAALLTIAVHILIALVTVGCYWLVSKYFNNSSKKKD